jgi:hypothetical protein
MADSKAQYVHRIHLLDANKNPIDPADSKAQPYSPMTTCGKCHDVKTIAHGYHFNAMESRGEGSRVGEPWFWTDARTGTQLPISYCDLPGAGVYKPEQLGITPWQFVMRFGRHLPGLPGAEATSGGGAKWHQSGPLLIDCLMCHGANRSYSPQVWTEQVQQMNFAWAPTAAAGLATIEGSVRDLLPDMDASKPQTMQGKSLPRTVYNTARFNAEKEVFIDVVRRPQNDNCNYCHTAKPAVPGATPAWNHDDDVHIKAGLSCVDCHRNGIDHQTVRGFEGEQHPAGASVSTLTCRGCHDSGRLGSPEPLHRGLPSLHLEKLACTVCHSSSPETKKATAVWTSMAHGLGIKSQVREAGDLPNIVQPVFKVSGGQVRPHRQMWPAFWGVMKDEKITPLDLEDTYETLRRVLRIRRDFREEIGSVRITSDEREKVLGPERAKLDESQWTDADRAKLAAYTLEKSEKQFREKLPSALKELKDKAAGGTPVYVSGGKVYALGADGGLSVTTNPAAEPYSWPLAHEVRPARQALGVKGCVECHSPGSSIFYSSVAAVGPAPDSEPMVTSLSSHGPIEPALLAAWEQSFGGHFTFKVIATVSFAVLSAVLLLYGLSGLGGVTRAIERRRERGDER